MNFHIDLTRDLAACQALRHEVFVTEQNVPLKRERDGLDEDALHFLARLGPRPVGTARMLIKGDTGKIGRVCVLPEMRGMGLGKALIGACLSHLETRPGITRAELGAQTHALEFYERFGFVAFGPVYQDAGIAHRDMERAV